MTQSRRVFIVVRAFDFIPARSLSCWHIVCACQEIDTCPRYHVLVPSTSGVHQTNGGRMSCRLGNKCTRSDGRCRPSSFVFPLGDGMGHGTVAYRCAPLFCTPVIFAVLSHFAKLVSISRAAGKTDLTSSQTANGWLSFSGLPTSGFSVQSCCGTTVRVRQPL